MSDISQIELEVRDQAELVVEFAKSLHPYNFVQYVRCLVEGKSYHLTPATITLESDLVLMLLQKLVEKEAPEGKINVLKKKFEEGKEYESTVVSGKRKL